MHHCVTVAKWTKWNNWAATHGHEDVRIFLKIRGNTLDAKKGGPPRILFWFYLFFIYHMHDNRSVCISAALYVKGGLCLFLTYLAFSRHFSIYTSKSSCKIRVFKKTFIFCLCFKEVGYQGIIFSLSQVHFIFSPCLPRIFERAHDESIGKPFALELLQFFTPYD